MAVLTESLGGDFEKQKTSIAFQAVLCTKLTAGSGALPTHENTPVGNSKPKQSSGKILK